MRVLLAALLLLSPVARAAEPLDGTWTFDAERSDAIDPLLDALGFSTFEKMIARTLRVTHVVDDMGDKVRVRIQATLKTVDRTVLLDDVPREEPTENGEPALVRYRRAPDGAVVAESHTASRDGAKVVLLTRRLVQPDGSMLVEIAVTKDGQAPFTVRRIFRRST